MVNARKIEKVMKTTLVEIVLGEQEASVLLTVLGEIGGDPDGPRGVIDKLHSALRSSGVNNTTKIVFSIHGKSLYIDPPGAN